MENFKGNYQKDNCYECGKEIIVSTELLEETKFISGYKAGARFANEKAECFSCARVKADRKDLIEKPKVAKKLLKFVKPVFKCPMHRCEHEFETKEELLDHLIKIESTYYMKEELKLKEKYAKQ